MAKVFCSKDTLVVAAKTSLFVFQYSFAENEFNLCLKKKITIDVEEKTASNCKQISLQSDNVLITSKTAGNEERPFSEADKQQVDPEGDSNMFQILGGGFSRDSQFFAVVTSMKTCVVFETHNDWNLRCSSFRLSKAPTSVTFDSKSEYVIVADRAGNVIRYSLKVAESATGGGKDDDVERRGELLLGHVSMILDIALSSCGKFICTADRDEKLRISRYPQSFVVHRFCLGHRSYVNCVMVVKDLVFTSGGDGIVRVWDITDGHLIATCNLFDRQRIRVFRIASLNLMENLIIIAVLLELSDAVQIIRFDLFEQTFKFASTFTAPALIIDIVFVAEGNGLIAITREAVLFVPVEDHAVMKVIDRIDTELLDALTATKDVTLCLEKKVGFNNVQEYQQRKTERILKRKRKLEVLFLSDSEIEVIVTPWKLKEVFKCLSGVVQLIIFLRPYDKLGPKKVVLQKLP